MGSGEMVAEITKTVTECKTHRNFVVVLSPVVQLPPELERLFIVVDHEPPTREELWPKGLAVSWTASLRCFAIRL